MSTLSSQLPLEATNYLHDNTVKVVVHRKGFWFFDSRRNITITWKSGVEQKFCDFPANIERLLDIVSDTCEVVLEA